MPCARSAWGDRLARAVFRRYDSLGRNGKPQRNEWTVLAAVVAEDFAAGGDETVFEVISLATGNKCVGMDKMCSRGEVLNGACRCTTLITARVTSFGINVTDSHAEILARRSFLRYAIVVHAKNTWKTNPRCVTLYRLLHLELQIALKSTTGVYRYTDHAFIYSYHRLPLPIQANQHQAQSCNYVTAPPAISTSAAIRESTLSATI